MIAMKVKPKAVKNLIYGSKSNYLKIQLKAAHEKDKAHEMPREVFASFLV
ncbi:MAG: hypothetical protein EBZ47_03075 [Chlamydiae bacterium]|nr:hypothetical protein [Chlamydiota bacterium]